MLERVCTKKQGKEAIELPSIKSVTVDEDEIKRALLLVTSLRLKALEQEIDPRATLIALAYANLAERYLARTKLTEQEVKALEDYAMTHFMETLKKCTTSGRDMF